MKTLRKAFVLIFITVLCAVFFCGCDKIGDAVDDAGKSVASILSDVSATAGEAINEAKNEFGDEISAARETISEGINDAKEHIDEGIDYAREHIGDELDGAREHIGEGLESARENIGEALTDIGEELTGENDYTFRTQELFDSHYEKHGAEFGSISQDEYLKKANELIELETALTKNDEDGDKMYYDSENNEFLVLSTDGYIRTFFKPSDGIDYWNRQ